MNYREIRNRETQPLISIFSGNYWINQKCEEVVTRTSWRILSQSWRWNLTYDWLYFYFSNSKINNFFLAFNFFLYNLSPRFFIHLSLWSIMITLMVDFFAEANPKNQSFSPRIAKIDIVKILKNKSIFLKYFQTFSQNLSESQCFTWKPQQKPSI